MAALLNRYAGDLPHGALRKEMLQTGLIAKLENGEFRVLKREYTYDTLDPEIVKQMSVALHDHAATLAHNLNGDRKHPARFEAVAENGRVPYRAAEKFMNLVESRGMDFLGEMDAWLSAQEGMENKDSGERLTRLGVGVFVICDDG